MSAPPPSFVGFVIDGVQMGFHILQFGDVVIRIGQPVFRSFPGGGGFQQDAHLKGVLDEFLIDFVDNGPFAHPEGDQSFCGKGLKGFPYGGAADAQLFRNGGQAQLLT